MIELRGERVLLRGYRPEEIDDALRKIELGMQRYGGVLDDDQEKRRIRRLRLERSGTRTEWEVLFALEVDGHVVGDVQGRCSDHAMPPGVWEIGIEIHDEADRGHGIGREAVALLLSHLYGAEGAHRVQATTDVENAAMRRVLEVLGFENEGTLRGFMPTPEGIRDYVMYGTTKDDWMVSEAWIRTDSR